MQFGSFGTVPATSAFRSSRPDILVNSFFDRDESSILYRSQIVENLDLEVPGFWVPLEAVVPSHPKEFMNLSNSMYKMLNIYYDKCIAEPIEVSSSHSCKRMYASIKKNPVGMKAMLGASFKPKKHTLIGKIGQERSGFLASSQ